MKAMARQRSHSIEFKRQVAQEFIAGETLYGLAKRHDLSRQLIRVGDIAFDQVYGKDSMHRFVYHTRDSFFHVGRGRRDTLVKEYGRLDPRIADIVLDEMRANWWRHLLVSIPLGWCGMWVGWLWSLLLGPAVWMGVCVLPGSRSRCCCCTRRLQS